MVMAECCDATKGDMMLAVSHESQGRAQEPVYYPAPYLTQRGQAPLCNSSSADQTRMRDAKGHTYDVPYPVKRLEMWDQCPEAMLTSLEEVYETEGSKALYRSFPHHVTKQKSANTKSWREDTERSSGSENGSEDLLDEDSSQMPETLIVPLPLDHQKQNGSTRSWKKYPSSHQVSSLRCAGEYTSIT